MSDSNTAPIVIKRIIQAGGHHGGAWKVAYADFVTGMMAFFLLMWLVNATNKQQKAAISEYFHNPSAEIGTSPTPRADHGMQGPGGASTSPIDMGGGFAQPPTASSAAAPETPEAGAEITQSASEQAEATDEAAMQKMAEELKEEMRSNADLAPFKDQVLIDMTSEGLRIMVVDRANKAMFNVGSAKMLPASRKILKKITDLVSKLPNRISITGHTDARPFVTPNYGNWELSADRANAARREMLADGLAPSRVARVVGLASSELYKPKDPMNPLNRRIAIIVLKKSVDKAQQVVEKPQAPAGDAGSLPPAAGE